jgi:hypothetical protein
MVSRRVSHVAPIWIFFTCFVEDFRQKTPGNARQPDKIRGEYREHPGKMEKRLANLLEKSA